MASKSTSDSNLRTVVLFGTTGVGKSSIINMLPSSGVKEHAVVENAAGGVTKTCSKFCKEVEDQQYLVFDTPGTGETEQGNVPTHTAIDLFYKLLIAQPRVDLVVLVMRAGRITKMEENNYNLIKILCGDEVPVALAVTHLDDEEGDINTWWERQPAALKKHFKFCEHACLVGLLEHPEYDASKAKVEALLTKGTADTGNGWSVEKKPWFGMFLDSVKQLVSRDQSKEKLHAKLGKLLDEYGVDGKKAKSFMKKLANMIIKPNDTNNPC